MSAPQHFEDARRAVAEMLAKECNEALSVGHHNEATKILWPHLSPQTQTALVLR